MEEEEAALTSLISFAKPQTCKIPQGLGSIFHSGKSSTATPASLNSSFLSPLLIFLSSFIFVTHISEHSSQGARTDPARHCTGESTVSAVPCSPLALGNPQQSECGLGGIG